MISAIFFMPKSYSPRSEQVKSSTQIICLSMLLLATSLSSFANSSLTTEKKLEQARALCLTANYRVEEHIKICHQQVDQIQPLNINLATELKLNIVNLHMKQGSFSTAEKTLKEIDVYQNELSGIVQIMVIRKRGVLKYRQGQYSQSLNEFKNAYELALRLSNDELRSKTLSDIGTAAMAIGLYETALGSYTESLMIKEKVASQQSIAITLNNIGRVYHKMEQVGKAELYFKKALTIYKKLKLESRVAHTQENIALVLKDKGAVAEGVDLLEQSYLYFEKSGSAPSTLRIALLLVEFHIVLNIWPKVEYWIGKASKIEQSIGKSSSLVKLLRLQAELLLNRAEFEQAELKINEAYRLVEQQNNQNETIEVLKLRIKLSQQNQNMDKLVQDYNQIEQLQKEINKQQYTTNLAYLQAEFEYNQQQNSILRLEKKTAQQQLEIAQQNQRNILIISSLVLIGLILAVLMYRKYLVQKARQDKLLSEIAWHREQVKILGESNYRLEMLLDKVDQATIALNHQQQIAYANYAACQIFEETSESIKNMNFLERIAGTPGELNNSLLRGESYQSDEIVEIVTGANNKVPVQVSVYSIDLNQEFQLITFQQVLAPVNQNLEKNFGLHKRVQSLQELLLQLPLDTLSQNKDIETLINQFEKACQQLGNNQPTESQQDRFRTLLVDVMNKSIELWEQQTQSNRIELAEQSGIWRVSIDDGRLRTRSLDRYLSMKAIPKKPRWREVVRTAHFVLAECVADTEARTGLSDSLKQLSQIVRERALA